MALGTEEVLAGLAELITDETGIDAGEVALEKSFTDDLDIDSISTTTIVVNAEEKFWRHDPRRRGQEPQDGEGRGRLHYGRRRVIRRGAARCTPVAHPPSSHDLGARETLNNQAHRRDRNGRDICPRRHGRRQLEESSGRCLRRTSARAHRGRAVRPPRDVRRGGDGSSRDHPRPPDREAPRRFYAVCARRGT